MRILALLLIVLISFSQSSSLIFAIAEEKGDLTKESLIVWPKDDGMQKLKNLTETYLTRSAGGGSYRSGCYGTLYCPKMNYTSLREKEIKFLIISLYEKNKSFFDSNFAPSMNYYGADSSTSRTTIFSALAQIPKATNTTSFINTIFSQNTFVSNTAGDLIDSSFGIDFTDSSTENDMLAAIEGKIRQLKQQKCKKDQDARDYNTKDFDKGLMMGGSSEYNCYSSNTPNRYLPTPEELYRESIYLNRTSVTIESLKGMFLYEIQKKEKIEFRGEFLEREFPHQYRDIFPMIREFNQTGTGNITNISKEILIGADTAVTLIDSTVNDINNNPSPEYLEKMIQTLDATVSLFGNSQVNSDISLINGKTIPSLLLDGLKKYKTESEGGTTYRLEYTKSAYTLSEAKDYLEEKAVANISTVFTSQAMGRLPCMNDTSYLVQSQCTAAMSHMKDAITAMGAYYADREKYPDTIDQLNTMYLPKGLSDFKKNFTYKNITATGGIPDYEITYIGKIGEDVPKNASGSMKKDYLSLIPAGQKAENIPKIFSHIPQDTIALYVKDPQSLIALLNDTSPGVDHITGIDISLALKKAIMDALDMQDFSRIEKNLKSDMAILIDNLDTTSPDIVLMLSDSDREALSPTGSTRVVTSKDGYIWVSVSKPLVEKYSSVVPGKSMADLPDFQYVWWKKGTKVRDALLFVSDVFFEKMLSLESYIAHYRKLQDTAHLKSLQELVWAYNDAFGKVPTSFLEIIGALGKGGKTGLDEKSLSSYTLEGSLVKHKNIGSLANMRGISESLYDMESISRKELESYKYNILKYREVWRASLDPMAIILNRLGDGISVDFFMTPIPSLEGSDIGPLLTIAESVAKDKLDYTTNPNIRTGIFSSVFGFDPVKMKAKLDAYSSVTMDYSDPMYAFKNGLSEMNKEILDGKDILDYLGGEFAITIGSIDPDIFEGWNTEKLDAYVSIQVQSEEKGKELIENIRKKLVGQFSRGSDSVSTLANAFVKPLIEEYRGKKIYKIEKIPYISSLNYAFINNFLTVGFNTQTLKNAIDTSLDGDKTKGELISLMASHNNFLGFIFDAKKANMEIQRYSSNGEVLKHLASLLEEGGFAQYSPLLGAYYYNYEVATHLGKPETPYVYNLGLYSISGEKGIISIELHPDKLNLGTGGLLKEGWDAIATEIGTEKKDITSLSASSIGKLMTYNIINTIFISRDDASFLRNLIANFRVGDDEVGFEISLYKKLDANKSFVGGNLSEKNILLLLGGIVLLIFLILGGVLFWRSRRYTSFPIISQEEQHLDASMTESIPVVSEIMPNPVESPLEMTHPSEEVSSIVVPLSGAISDTHSEQKSGL